VEVCFYKWRYTEVQVLVEGRGLAPPLEVCEGVEFLASSEYRALQLLTDLGYLSSRKMTRIVVFDETYKDRLLFYAMHKRVEFEPTLAYYTVHKVPPRTDWFDLFSFFHPQEDDQGVLENLSMLSTMYE
jgi:hypothetical protein